MEDNNSTNTTNESEASKTVKEKKDNKKNDKKKSAASFFNIYKAEFKKITWPNKETLIKQTITVIIVSLIVGAIIFGYDTAFAFVRDKALELLVNK